MTMRLVGIAIGMGIAHFGVQAFDGHNWSIALDRTKREIEHLRVVVEDSRSRVYRIKKRKSYAHVPDLQETPTAGKQP